MYQELTKDMIASYSKKGTPWDNACIESFHSLIKKGMVKSIQNYRLSSCVSINILIHRRIL